MPDTPKGSVFEELKKVPPEKRQAALSYLMAMKTRAQKKPNHVILELTPLCPLSCKMCYIKQEGLKPGAVQAMLDGKTWISFVDQIVQQGVESLTLTGGEVFSYKDFFDVYEYAYDKGLEITLMSNAMLIDEAAVARLVNRPPKFICVTLYGASAENYGRLCGDASAYDKVCRALDLIQNAGLPFVMQSTITKENANDLEAMKSFAASRGVAYRYSANLFSSRECSPTCAAEEIAEMQSKVNQRKRIIEKLKTGVKPELEIKTHGTLCGAGRNSYHINWRGEMQPCILMDMHKVSVLNRSIEEAWQDIRDWTAQIPQLVECQECPAYLECGDHCLAAHYAETGRFGLPALRRCVKRQLEEAEKNEK